MKKWEIIAQIKNKTSETAIEDIIDILLKNRGLKTKKEKDAFLMPTLSNVTTKSVGIDQKQLIKTVKRIEQAIKYQEQIIVFGDYDVDGITSSAIIWETINLLGGKILPYIPHRIDEGYGLSEIGITNLMTKIPNVKLIITVDNGIVANTAVDFANKNGVNVIITDHHVMSELKPNAYSIVHTTKLCGAGVAYLLSKEIKSQKSKVKDQEDTHLELAALGTVADMVPLTDANRAIVKHGLEKLSHSKRPGLKALYRHAGSEKDILNVYEVGYIIAPRLNAAGRIESAMDSLRLLCTKDPKRAELLAERLEAINKERQVAMNEASEHAILSIRDSFKTSDLAEKIVLKNLLFVVHETYQQGVIGLVAGKLVEEFYRPAIVISKGEKHSKASARSIKGFDMIEFLRRHPTHFVNVGGHPMAAGFTVETENIPALQKALEKTADEIITEEILKRGLKIDLELPLSEINHDLYNAIQALSPFGIGNPEPTFSSTGVKVKGYKLLGKEKNHLKLQLMQGNSQVIDAIAFKMGNLSENLNESDIIDIAYTIDLNTWNGNSNIQLKIKDIKTKNDK